MQAQSLSLLSVLSHLNQSNSGQLVQFTAACIAVIVTSTKASVTAASIAMWNTSVLNASLLVEPTVVVPDATASHGVPSWAAHDMVVATATAACGTCQSVPCRRLATHGVHSEMSPA